MEFIEDEEEEMVAINERYIVIHVEKREYKLFYFSHGNNVNDNEKRTQLTYRERC
jgi:hypothetical protein